MGKLVYGVSNVSVFFGSFPHIVTLVVVTAGSNVIASSGVDSERFSVFGTFVVKDFDSLWIK